MNPSNEPNIQSESTDITASEVYKQAFRVTTDLINQEIQMLLEAESAAEDFANDFQASSSIMTKDTLQGTTKKTILNSDECRQDETCFMRHNEKLSSNINKKCISHHDAIKIPISQVFVVNEDEDPSTRVEKSGKDQLSTDPYLTKKNHRAKTSL